MAIAWITVLDKTKAGPRSTLANAVTVLQKDPIWGPAVFWYDDFLDRVLTVVNGVTREWRDDDDTRVTVYLQQSVQMFTISESQVASAVRYVAKQRVRNCVRDYFSSLKWNGTPVLATAFETYWGAPITLQQPAPYLRAISANFILGMVARVQHPGCQLDNMVVFEGDQGIGKSRALRALGGAWYMLAAESVTHKDFFQSFPGKLLVEIGEMEAFSRAERERVKLAISTPSDRYRSSYGRRAEDHPRQCVFVGTTNRADYGNDDTGLRRFWPVKCGSVDVPGLLAARDQLFAEAVARIRANESWWTTPTLDTLAVQRDRQHEDVWTTRVLDWVVGRPNVTIEEVLEGAVKMRVADMTRTEQVRVGGILRLAGWEPKTVRREGLPMRAWVAPVVMDVTESAAF